MNGLTENQIRMDIEDATKFMARAIAAFDAGTLSEADKDEIVSDSQDFIADMKTL